jgi:alanine dehydrogenase
LIIGVPKEIKENEGRVAIVPSGVRALREAGHRVLVEAGAGEGSSIHDGDYEAAGAEMCAAAGDVWGPAALVVKVKEPVEREFGHLRDGLMVFAFLHLAANGALAAELLKKGVTAIGYETVEIDDGSLPILAPMSAIAGRLSVLEGVHYLTGPCGGSGVLISGVPGVPPGGVAILGAGIVGLNAARMAVGLGARVTVLDVRAEGLRRVDEAFGGRVSTCFSNPDSIEDAVIGADILVGAVHSAGLRAPRLVSRRTVARMRKGSVIVDVSVDQGGCVETIRPTTHSDPVYVAEGVVHYGVANMPGAVPRTATYALTAATLPYLLALAMDGMDAVRSNPSLRRGVNTHSRRVTHPSVAASLGETPAPEAIG